MAGEDPEYLKWLRQQPCDVFDGTCMGPIEAHHSTGRKRGIGTKNHDHTCIPLCHKHHVHDFHMHSGHFRDWDREKRAAWQFERSTEYRCRYLAKDCF
jgi:hypothetical protein